MIVTEQFRKMTEHQGKSSGKSAAGTFSIYLRNCYVDKRSIRRLLFRKFTELFRNYHVDKRKKSLVIVP